MTLFNLFISFILLFSSLHDYHVGIYDIELKNNQLQITQKLFTDDFEKALEKDGSELKFTENNQDSAFKKSIETYINKHFSILKNGQILKLNFLGMEWEDYHVIYLYWESEVVKTGFESLEINNDIFLEISEDQQNMHRIKFNGKEKSLLLEKGRTTGLVSLSD